VSLSSFAAPTDLETDVRIGVKLVISDDGVGFDRSGVQSEHLGLGIMVERAADVGADLSIISEVGSGTTVTVTWPSDSGNQHG
jgi:nitrate/nitrite-specific signal transduction histidine kinase